MPTDRRSDDDGSDLIEFIESKGGRVEKSVGVPSPDGRNTAGWVTIQNLKIQPEIVTQLEQLREHRVFQGKWKTTAQVAWSMIYLGLHNMKEFVSTNEGDWDSFRAAYAVMEAANRVEKERAQERLLQKAAESFRAAVHEGMGAGTAFGKYSAWKAIDEAVKARESVQDLQLFDKKMRMGHASAVTPLLMETYLSDIWKRLFPVIGGSLDERNLSMVYDSLTSDYFEELDAIRMEEADDEG